MDIGLVDHSSWSVAQPFFCQVAVSQSINRADIGTLNPCPCTPVPLTRSLGDKSSQNEFPRLLTIVPINIDQNEPMDTKKKTRGQWPYRSAGNGAINCDL